MIAAVTGRPRICFLAPRLHEPEPERSCDPVVAYTANTAARLAARGWRIDIVSAHEDTASVTLAAARFRKAHEVEIWNAADLARRTTPRIADVWRGCHRLQGRSDLMHLALRALATVAGEAPDFIEYPENGAAGFIPAQMHRALRSYGDAQLICRLHGSHQQRLEGDERDGLKLEEIKASWFERSSCANADVRRAVSVDIAQWAAAHWGGDIATPDAICHPWRPLGEPVAPSLSRPGAPRELVFLGGPNLDERSGLLTFLDALAAAPAGSPLRFLGLPGRIAFTFSSDTSRDFITARLPARDTAWTIETASSEEKLLQRLPECAALAVYLPRSCPVPTAILLELLRRGIPFVAAATGCIPAVLGTELTARLAVEPGAAVGLRRRIAELQAADAAQVADIAEQLRRRYRAIDDEAPLVSFYDALAEQRRGNLARPSRSQALPAATVVIPFFNTAPYVDRCLDSLESQTMPSRILLVDDGCDDPAALAKLDEIRRRRPTVEILRKPNGGVGDALNHALPHVETSLMIAFDSDNIARPTLVETLVTGMHNRPEVAALSCHNGAFYDADEKDVLADLEHYQSAVRWYWKMMGPALPVLHFENVMGDACAVLSTQVLREVGGYPDDKKGFHDWAMWLKLIACGYRIDVLPQVLYFHRQRPGSDGRLKKWFYVDIQNRIWITEHLRRRPEEYIRDVLPNLHKLGRDGIARQPTGGHLVRHALRTYREGGLRVTARRSGRWLLRRLGLRLRPE